MEKDNNGLDTNMDIINTDDRGGPVAVVAEGAPMGPSMISTLGAASSMPPIGNMSVYKSKLHYGPKIVSVSVTNNEVVKGRVLGLDLETSKPKRKCRISIIICVYWALFVACGICALILSLITLQQYRMDIGLNESWYLRRADWQAMPAYTTEFLNLPVEYVVFGHSAEAYCDDRYRCIDAVLAIQQDHFRRAFSDIGPNFLVGGSGYILEGRGANVIGAVVKHWNTKIISILFLGNYNNNSVDDLQINHLKKLMEVLVAKKILVSNYAILGHCQIKTETWSPGTKVMSQINKFSHWDPRNSSGCLGFRTRN